ncbi:MAG TPA: c-type cytochrome [Terriglobia bacterium]|nr:c-type cytochrome [Terriglobia bacterium]
MHRRLEMSLISAAVLLAVIGIFSFSGNAAAAQTPQSVNPDSKSIWEGVFTVEQAARGKTQYETSCGRCHGADLSGGIGQQLKGDVFVRGWYGYPLNSLFSRIRSTMPSGAARSLSDDVYLDIVAYLLQANGFPSGSSAFRTESLESIRIEGKEGPQPIPNYALVRVVGCLTQGPQNSWMLTNTSEAVRTRDPEASKDEELKNSIAKKPGTRQLRLMNIYPVPDPYKGHKVEVKGFLIQGAGEHLNVNALQTLASTCSASDRAGIELPDGDGKIILERSCTTCHDLGTLALFKGYYTEELWRDLIQDMVKVGAQLKGDEITIVAQYLAKYFGPQK